MAALSLIATTFLEKEYDFWVAYLLTAAALLLSIVIFLVWQSKFGEYYRIQPELQLTLTDAGS